MAEKLINTRILQKTDTSKAWKLNNPILKAGEVGYESDTHLSKVGDGSTSWNSLDYIASNIVVEVDALPVADYSKPRVIYAIGKGDATRFFILKNELPLKVSNKKNGATVSSSFNYTFENNAKPEKVMFNGQTTTDNSRGITKEIGNTCSITAYPDGRINVNSGSGDYKGTYNATEKITFEANGKQDSDTFYASIDTHACVLKGTKVQLESGEYKNIEDVKYSDKLLCWNFNVGKPMYSNPVWIMKSKKAERYNKLTFDDGSELCTINQHRIFNKEKGMFTYPMTEDTPIGTTSLNSEGKYVKLINKEIIEKECEYYNIMTSHNINLFTNNILTSSRLSNMYPIYNLQYSKENASKRNEENLSKLPDRYIFGLCLNEQPQWEEISKNSADFGNSLVEYVKHLIKEEVGSNVK